MDRLARLVILLALSGCGGGAGETTAANVDSAKMRTMAGLYAAYMREHNNQPPPDEQTFRSFLGTKQEGLDRAGLTIDQIFLSPRSGGPLVWAYGKKLPAIQGGMQFIAYEATPVDGKRLAIATRGMYEEMDEARFQTAFPNTK